MKKAILIFSLFFAVIQSFSQEYKVYKHNIDFNFGGGLHSVQFDPTEGGDHRMRMGGTFNAQYRYAMDENWSFAIGLGFTTYCGKSKYDLLQDNMLYTDPENGEEYHFKATFTDWNEIQRSFDFEVPIAAYYRYPINPTWSLVGGAGFKLDVPTSKKFKTKNESSGGELVRSGEFESTNVEYSDLPQHGFYGSDEYEGKAKMKGAGMSMFGEVGVTRPLKNNMSLYLGTYFSHSLINSLKESDNHLYDPENEKYCGVVSSDLVKKTHLLAFGVKAGLSLGFPRNILPPIDTALLAVERLAAEQAEAERLAAEKKAEEERLAAEQAEAERLAAEQAEAERLAAEKKAEEERLAAEQAESDRIAAEKKAEEDRLAAEKAETERIAAEKKAEEKRIAAEKAEAERLAAEKKAEEERIAAEKKAEEERIEAEAVAQAEAAVEWINKNLVVNFDLGKANILSNEEIDAKIQFLIEFLQKYPERKLLIKGHTCDLGNPATNVKLSKQRADAMKTILVLKGCNPNNIVTKGMGSAEPLVPNTNEENRKKNRRIEMQIEKILKE